MKKRLRSTYINGYLITYALSAISSLGGNPMIVVFMLVDFFSWLIEGESYSMRLLNEKDGLKRSNEEVNE